MADSKKSNGKADIPPDDGVTHLPRTDADKGREPKLLSSRLGSHTVSQAALIEKIVSEFTAEHGEDSAALQEADTEMKRLKLVRDAAQYVMSIESVNLAPEEQADIIRCAYAELFAYGPLDKLFCDERVTTIALEGTDKVSVRYGHDDLVSLGPIFEDYAHMRAIVRRLLVDAGAELHENIPIIEAGLTAEGRPVCVNVVAPPVTIQLTADIRVHPKSPPTLDDLVSSGFMTGEAATVLRALAASPHGFVIVGDTESGKTTLLSTLAQLLPEPERIVSVERAGELHLPEGAKCLTVCWPKGEHVGLTFGQQVGAVLEKEPGCIILDEVRSDEAYAIGPLLAWDNVPRQIWTFRGPSFIKRLRSALDMVARRADTLGSGRLVDELYQRLPFIISVKRARGAIQLRSIAEWQSPEGANYTDFVELMEMGWEGAQLTGKRPLRSLDLPDSFWDNS